MSEECLKHLLNLRKFEAQKFAEDGTLVPKRVGFGT
jgi:hypothetical protein